MTFHGTSQDQAFMRNAYLVIGIIFLLIIIHWIIFAILACRKDRHDRPRTGTAITYDLDKHKYGIVYNVPVQANDDDPDEEAFAEQQRRQFMAEQRRLMSDRLRYEVLKRDNFRCQICGATSEDGVKLHVDHIRPVSKGGKTELSNLRTLCERCNMGKSDSLE